MSWVNSIILSIGAMFSSLLGMSHSAPITPLAAEPVATSSQTMAQWQTYAGSGFSVEYPAGWTLIDPAGNYHSDSGVFQVPQAPEGFTPDRRYEIDRGGGSDNATVLSVDSAMAGNPSLGQVSTSTVSVDGVTGIKVEEVSRAGGSGTWYNDDMYVLFQKGSVQYQLQGLFESTAPSRHDTFTTFYNSFKG